MILAAITLLAASVSAPASAAPVTAAMLEPAFTATVLSTYPDGRTSKLWLNRDGTFTGEERDHARKGGRWNLQGQSICLRQTKPVPIPFLHFCSPIPSTGVSVAWNGKAITGEPIVIRLIPGR